MAEGDGVGRTRGGVCVVSVVGTTVSTYDSPPSGVDGVADRWRLGVDGVADRQPVAHEAQGVAEEVEGARDVGVAGNIKDA